MLAPRTPDLRLAALDRLPVVSLPGFASGRPLHTPARRACLTVEGLSLPARSMPLPPAGVDVRSFAAVALAEWRLEPVKQ